jgi:hypothetical protein
MTLNSSRLCVLIRWMLVREFAGEDCAIAVVPTTRKQFFLSFMKDRSIMKSEQREAKAKVYHLSRKLSDELV